MVGKRFFNYVLMLSWYKVSVLTSLRLLFLASFQPPCLEKVPKNFTILKWWWVVTWFNKDDLPWVKHDNHSCLLFRYKVIKSLKVSIKDGPENDFKYFTPRFMLWCLFWLGHFTVRDWCFDFRIYRINHNIKVVHS